MTETAKRYRAFISYSHRDSGWASWLHNALEHYRPPKDLVGTVTERGAVPKRLHPVFRDRDELASATDLGTLINAALRGSACQIVICSPPAAKSKWVNEEILAFKRLGREDRIFCLIVAGEPNASDMPGREDEECFPPALRFQLGADGALSTVRTEPIAADARPGKDGRNNAKLKLIAGVLGVGFDALKRRDQQRRNRRLFIFSCAALVGMLFTSGLAAYALFERAAAQRQTARAEAEAVTATATTEFLVNLFRISDPSEARGNSVTAREMLDKGAARIDHELAGEPAIQARLMDTLGTVYMGLGLYTEARPLLDRSVEERRRVANGDPLELSASLSHEADLLTEQADYEVAEKAYREAIRIQSARPQDPHSQVQLAHALMGFGTLLWKAGRYPEAEKYLRDALQLQHRLYGESHQDIATTMRNLAMALSKDGDLNEAIPLMQGAVAMQRQLHASEADPDLADSINDLAVLLYDGGDFGDAETLLREALAMYRHLYGERHTSISTVLEMLGNVVADKGDLAAAVPFYRQSIAMRRVLLGDNHPDLARTLGNLASVQYDLGDTRAAFESQDQAVGMIRRMFPNDNPEVARLTNISGFWLTLAGDYPQAERDVDEALAMRRRLFGDHNAAVAASLSVMAILRNAEGRYAEALDAARAAKEMYVTALSSDHWRTAVAESAEGAALTGLGRYPEAEPRLLHSNEILARGGSPLSYRRVAAHYLETLHAQQRRRRSLQPSTRPAPVPAVTAKAAS